MKKPLVLAFFLFWLASGVLIAQTRVTRIGDNGFYGVSSFSAFENPGGLFVDDAGRAIVIEQIVQFSEDGQANRLMVRSFGGEGESQWETPLENFDDYVVASGITSENELLLSLKKPAFTFFSGSISRDALSVGLPFEFKETINLVCIDTDSGTPKWSLTRDGILRAFKSSGKGIWYVYFTELTPDGPANQLMAINGTGDIVFQITTHEPIGVDVKPGN